MKYRLIPPHSFPFGHGSNVTKLAWSADGSMLAIVQEKTQDVFFWDASTQKPSKMDSGEKSTLTCMAWSSTGLILALGTAKGNVVIYNHNSARKIPCLGVHTAGVGALLTSLPLGTNTVLLLF